MKKLKKAKPPLRPKKNRKSKLKLRRLSRKRKLVKGHNRK